MHVHDLPPVYYPLLVQEEQSDSDLCCVEPAMTDTVLLSHSVNVATLTTPRLFCKVSPGVITASQKSSRQELEYDTFPV